MNDFDQNGSIEPIFSFTRDQKEYPIALRQDVIKQMSSLKKQFVFYKDYADKTVPDIYEQKLLEKATHHSFYQPNTSILINNQRAGFELMSLPMEAQYAPVYAIDIEDVNGDTKMDIILGGNLFSVKPEVGRYDALHGLVLAGDGTGKFVPLTSLQSGIRLTGEVRHINSLKTKTGKLLALVRNNDTIKFYKHRD